VGPDSAGAEPGPACYGRGGVQPTVTDAHLLLGRLSPDGLIGGGLALDGGLARRALDELASGLGLGADEAALGVLAVLEENMAGAIRQAAARQGDDLRDFALVAGGGAGPLHAASVMRTLGMRATVVPTRPGLLSALGLLAAHLRHDHVTPLLGVEGSIGDTAVEDAFASLRGAADRSLADDGVPKADRRFEPSLDLRYLGQEYTLRVPTTGEEPLSEVIARFHQLHDRVFGHSAPSVRTEVVAARMVGVGVRALPDVRHELPQRAGAPLGRRDVLFAGEAERRPTAVYRRADLAGGQVLDGPAIVEQLDTTTLVPSGCRARVHATGSLIITEAAAA
jgi:N-methylhydantoinase A